MGARRRVASGSPELIAELSDSAALSFRDGDPERAPMFASLGLRSLFTVPLRAATRTVGTLALGRTRSEKWSGEDQSLAVDVGRRAGMLIDNATVLDAEHRALAASDAARARLVLLAELGMGLSSSLDLDPVLDHLASLLVPGLATSTSSTFRIRSSGIGWRRWPPSTPRPSGSSRKPSAAFPGAATRPVR